MNNRFLSALGLAALLALLPAAARGQNNNWIGLTGGDWNNAANWSLGVVPTPAHTVGIFTNTVILNSAPAATAGALNVGLGSELHIFNGASLAANNGNIGFVGTGLLQVSGAGTQAAFLPSSSTASLILGGPGSTGTLTVENGALVQTGSALDQGVSLGIAGGGTGHIQLNATGVNRGLLATSGIQRLGAGTLTFNGGVLRALVSNSSFLTGFAASDVTLNAGGAFIDSGGFDIGISAPMSGPGGLTKLGAGTLALTGANTYAGGTTVSAGALQIGDGGTSGSLTGNILNNAALIFNRGDALAYGGDISGAGTLTKLGAGTLTLTGANTYTGDTTVGAGVLRVSGAGSIAHPGGTLSIGSASGQTSTLEILGGGDVASLQALIGSSGIVTVSGMGSTLTNSGLLWIGGDTLGNTLTIENGATVSVGGDMRIAVNPAGDGALNIGAFDLANPTTAGALQAVSVIFGLGGSAGAGVINFNHSDATTFSANISGPGSLVQRGSGTSILTGAGTHTGGTTVSAGTLSIGGGGTSGSIAGNIALSNASSLAFNRADDLTYGGQVSGIGTLTKLGAGTLTLTGANTYAAGTRVKTGVLRVSGAGSIDHPFAGADMIVGELAGDQGTLEILAGGSVTNAFGRIGNAAGSTGSATVSGAGSNWTNHDGLWVGREGSDNHLAIQDGGSVSSGVGYIGQASTANNNSALVSGVNAAWTNAQELVVGVAGSDNTLTIQSGGGVSSTIGYIGDESTANTNGALVSGADSTWTNAGELYIGYSGSSNTLTIEDGGRVTSTNGAIGYNIGANSNSALVRGADATWENSGGFAVGHSGSGNTLTIENGGSVSASNGNSYIGFNATADDNHVLVSGEDSVWTNTGDGDPFSGKGFSYVGYRGTGNSLTIENGGTVFSFVNLYVGRLPGSDDNSLIVRGEGSALTMLGPAGIIIGALGSGNTLLIEDGGRVSYVSGLIGGLESTSNNNRVTVSGAGSTWTNEQDLFVGARGSGNTLTIADGGTVVCGGDGAIGFLPVPSGGTIISPNNSVLVSGTNSAWTIAQRLNVATDNTLTVEKEGRVTTGDELWLVGGGNLHVLDGGTLVSSNNAFVGIQGTGTTMATATVSGAGSRWSNTGYLVVGQTSGHNGTLTIKAGGSVSTTGDGLYVGQFSGAAGTIDIGAFDLAAPTTGGTLEAPFVLFGAGTGLINFNQTDATTFGVPISGPGSVVQRGNGTTTLTGASTYTGGTTISAGTLRIADVGGTNSVLGTGDVLVGPLGTLGGTGTILGATTVEGTLSPGNSAGLMEFGGSLTLGPLTNLDIELGGLAPGSQFDQLVVAGNLTLAGTLDVSLIDDFTLSLYDSFEIVDINGARSGTFSGLAEGAAVGNFGGTDLFITYTGGDGNDVMLFAPGLPGDFNLDGKVDAADYVVWRKTDGSPESYVEWRANFGATSGTGSSSSATIPEPQTVLLLLFGVGVVGWRRRPLHH